MGPEDVVEGAVRAVTVYGVFVDFLDGATGLLHSSHIPKGRAESHEALFLVHGRSSNLYSMYSTHPPPSRL